MATKKKPAARVTTGASYSGKHRALRRHVSATKTQFDQMDAAADRAGGLSWSQWILALGLKAAGVKR